MKNRKTIEKKEWNQSWYVEKKINKIVGVLGRLTMMKNGYHHRPHRYLKNNKEIYWKTSCYKLENLKGKIIWMTVYQNWLR